MRAASAAASYPALVLSDDGAASERCWRIAPDAGEKDIGGETEAKGDRLGPLIGRIGSELERLAALLARIGVSDEETPRTADHLPASQIVALQSVDQAEQTLRELALVLRRMAACDVAAARLDLAHLAEGLPLAHTVAVVLGQDAILVDGGDLDLF